MSIDVVGDGAVVVVNGVEEAREFVLAGARGVVSRWRNFDPEHSRPNTISFATLADPARFAVLRRRGRGHAFSELDVVDVATGEVQYLIPRFAEIVRLLAWLPSGDALLVEDGDGLALLRDDGRKTRVGDFEPGRPTAAWFASDGTRALVRFEHEAARIDAFDLVDGTRLWSLSSAAHSLVASADLTSFAIAHGGAVESFDVDNTELRPQLILAAAPDPTLALWSNAKLDVLAVRSRRRNLQVLRRAGVGGPGTPWTSTSEFAFAPVDVDVERGLALVVTGRGGVELRTLGGVLLSNVRPSFRACLAMRGTERVAAALVDGALHVLDASGTVTLVEGPTQLTDIAPHARGVVAVDDQMCAHVIELTS
jgi:hypothetical protein